VSEIRSVDLVIPVYDEEANLPALLERLKADLEPMARHWRVIFVDDGSRDRSWEIVCEAARHDPRIRGVRLARNFGQHAAIFAGFARCEADAVVTLDADLQNPPGEIPRLLAKLEEGYDAAIGNRRDYETRFVLHPRHFPYIGWRHTLGWVFIRFAQVLVGIEVDDSQCGFKCYRTEIAQRFFPQVEDDRFAFDVELLALLQHHGCRVAALPLTYIYREQASTLRLFRDGREMLGNLIRMRRKFRRLRRARGSRTNAP